MKVFLLKMNKKASYSIIIAVVVAILVLGYWYLTQPYKEINNPSISVLNLSSYNLSDNILTDNLTIVCVSGYSTTVRNVSNSLKNQVYQRDNITKSKETAIDHIIPLCLGGSNHISNLRAMYITDKVKKDNLERYLCNSHVCDGEIDINYAQERIYRDWYSYYLEIYGAKVYKVLIIFIHSAG